MRYRKPKPTSMLAVALLPYHLVAAEDGSAVEGRPPLLGPTKTYEKSSPNDRIAVLPGQYDAVLFRSPTQGYRQVVGFGGPVTFKRLVVDAPFVHLRNVIVLQLVLTENANQFVMDNCTVGDIIYDSDV